jgi:hypothetical protein
MRRPKDRVKWASLSVDSEGRPIVCLRSNGAPRCLRFDSQEQLKQLIAGHRLSVRRWLIAVPNSLCIIKQLSLPTDDFAEAIQMVGFEIPSLVPVSPEEVSYGCTLLGRTEKRTNVLVWILKLTLLEQCLAPCRAVDVEPSVALPEALAIHRWFASTQRSDQTSPSIGVLAGSDMATIVAAHHGRFQECLQVVTPHDSNGSLYQANVETHPFQEQGGQIDAHERVTVLLAGEDPCVSRLSHHFRAAIQDVNGTLEILNGPKIVPYPPDRQEARPCNDHTHEAIVAEGLLVAQTDPVHEKANLLPREYLQRHHRQATLFAWIQFVATAAAACLLIWAWLLVENWRLKQGFRAVHAEIAPIRDVAASVEVKRERLSAINHQWSHRGQIGRLIKDLYEHTPESISFYELSLNAPPDSLSLDIKGQADFLPTALDYTSRLRDAKLLAGLQITNAQQVPQSGGGSIVEFTAHCTIRDN